MRCLAADYATQYDYCRGIIGVYGQCGRIDQFYTAWHVQHMYRVLAYTGFGQHVKGACEQRLCDLRVPRRHGYGA